MKKILLLLFAVLSGYTASVFSQVSIDWLRSINGHPEGGVAIARDASNNTYAADYRSAFIYPTKRDQFGDFQWEVTSTSVLGEIPVRVFVDPQGNLVVVGFRYSTLHEGPFAVSLIVLKYDPGGKLDVSSLKSGIYMLRVFDNADHFHTMKFIKE